jgi:hypothetical protein
MYRPSSTAIRTIHRTLQLQHHFSRSQPTTATFTTTSSQTMAPVVSWDRLVRYVSAKDGEIRYGEPIVSDAKPDIDQLAQDGKLEVNVLEGANPIVAKANGEKDTVKQLLGPLTPKDVPIIRCVGLNYKTHSTFTHFRHLHQNNPIRTRLLTTAKQFSRLVSTSPKTQPCSPNPVPPSQTPVPRSRSPNSDSPNAITKAN